MDRVAKAKRLHVLDATNLENGWEYIRVLETENRAMEEGRVSLKQEILCCRKALFLAQRARETDSVDSTSEYCDMTLDCERKVDTDLQKEIAAERKALAAKRQEGNRG